MVFDVAAASGGALTILNYFYNQYKIDRGNQYIFIVSKPALKETDNIKVLRYPWVKKSWLHRIYFDYFKAPRLVEEQKIDEIMSLQNILIPYTKVKQTIYIHNSLPFSEYRFSFFQNTVLWFYQNIYKEILFRSIIKADEIIVQTEWMKKACIEKVKINEAKIKVLPVVIDYLIKSIFVSTKRSMSTFFYPASGIALKNHKVIIEACLKLKHSGITDYKVIFTLTGTENKYVEGLYKVVKKNCLPVEFIGNISREDVFDYYTRSVLLFPSFIETVGLPLVEAKLHGTPILVSNSFFAHEILEGYNNVKFFESSSSEGLFYLIMESLLKVGI